MQAEDVVRLVSGGSRNGFSRMLRDGIASQVVSSLRDRFTGGDPVAEEVLDVPDNESEVEEEDHRRQMIQGFMPHMLFFLYIVGVTFNFAAANYAVARKACLTANATDDFCSPWKNLQQVYGDNIQFPIEKRGYSNKANADRTNTPSLPSHQYYSAEYELPDSYDELPESSEDILQRKHHHKSSQAKQTTELYVFYQGLVAFVPPAILVLFYASCCDEFSSFRLPLTLSVIGAMITTTANLALSFFPDTSLLYDLLTPIVEAAFGGFPLALMCVYVATATSVPRKDRTRSFFLLQIAFLLAFSVARLICAIIVNNTHETLPCFIVALVMLSATLLFLAFCVQFVDLQEAEVRHRRGHHQSTNDPVLLGSRLFSHHHLFSSVRGLVSDRVRGSRYELLFLVACVFFLVATTRSSISSFFLDADPDTVVTDSVIIIVALLLIIPLFVLIIRALPFDSNLSITIIGVVFLFVGQSLQYATNNPALGHVRQIMHLISNIAPAGIRAHVGTLVERKEFGKAYGALAACEAIAPLVGTALRRFFGHGFGQLTMGVLLVGGLAFLGYHELKKRRSNRATEVIYDE